MAGTPGNPNHDPKTGRFASKSGLNKNNSTVTQRGKAAVKEQISALKIAAYGTATAAVGAIGAAVLQGVTKPIRARGSILSDKIIDTASRQAQQLVATHGPTITKAIRQHGSTLANHVKNMKIAGKTQHNVSSISSKSSSFKSPSQLKSELSAIRSPSKPRVRVPMGRK